VRLSKAELQKLADETGLTIRVRHCPPGTSKWNRIEHRLFCHITQNWRGRPLNQRLTVVELIGATTTTTGLKVECAIDPRTYLKGVKVPAETFDAIHLVGDAFHPEWNYSIRPDPNLNIAINRRRFLSRRRTARYGTRTSRPWTGRARLLEAALEDANLGDMAGRGGREGRGANRCADEHSADVRCRCSNDLQTQRPAAGS
jgi:hypothetical protein